MQIKSLTILLLTLLSPILLGAQDIIHDTIIAGKVTYISVQNVYVRFASTHNIEYGDTIFRLEGDKKTQILIVEQKSSISVVGKRLNEENINIGDQLWASIPVQIVFPTKPDLEYANHEIDTIGLTIKQVSDTSNIDASKWNKQVYSRVALSSYSGLSNTSANDSYRFRYTASLKATHIADSRFSVDSYLAFSHRKGEWEEVKADIFEALKVYSLAVGSEFGDHSNVWIGRRINKRMSSLGAIDGLQAETTLKSLTVGGVIGSRPDHKNYNYNPKLFEFGGFVAHDFQNKTGNMQNSMALFEQKNNGAIDRRFAYFQHNNTLVNRLNLFISGEIDIYRIQEGQISTKPSLTSLYLSARYSVNKKLSLYTMYDARKNVIYFETYKDYAERLLEEATRQGFQVKMNYRPIKYLRVGLSGGFRTREGDIRPNQNIRAFIGLSRNPRFNASLTATSNFIRTSYLDGMVLNFRLSKDLIPGKLSNSFVYRFVDYTFINTESKLIQHSFQTYFSYQIRRLSSVSVNYELNLELGNRYHRIYFNFVQRFKN